MKQSSTESIPNSDLPTVEDQINAIGIGQFHHSLIVMVTLLCMADGMEMLVISLLSTTLQKEWGVSTVEMGGLASAIFLGVLIGSLLGGFLGDRYGRRTTVLIGGTIFILGAVLSALAPSLVFLCLFRAVLGLGFGLFLPAAICNFSELLPTESRSWYQLFLTGIAWAMGEIIVCIAAIVMHRYFEFEEWWRAVLLFCALPGLVGVLMAYTSLPESPQYLSVQGRHDEVEALVRRIAEQCGRSDALLQGGRVHRVTDAPDAEWSWLELFSKQLILITAAVTAIWSIGSFSYYGLTFAYPLVLEQRYHMVFEDQYWAVLLAAAAEIPGVILAIYGVTREELGRRRCMALFFAAAAAAAVVVRARSRISFAHLGCNLCGRPRVRAPHLDLKPEVVSVRDER